MNKIVEGDRVRVTKRYLNRLRMDCIYVKPIEGVGRVHVAWFRLVEVIWDDGFIRPIPRHELEVVRTPAPPA